MPNLHLSGYVYFRVGANCSSVKVDDEDFVIMNIHGSEALRTLSI